MSKIIIANWKMNPSSPKEAEKFFLNISKAQKSKDKEIVICPPFVFIDRLRNLKSKISIGAQNVFFEKSGPFTGEVSVLMLKDLKVSYAIVGHSERRSLGETNIDINKKIKSLLSFNIKPILCVGELERDDNHEYFSFIKNQIEECLDGISKNMLSKVIIAYEPVWALSTNQIKKSASAYDSYEMSIFIKKIITDKFGAKITMPKIIYGGSVDDKNYSDFLLRGGVDGVLVGGASLNLKKILEIIN